VAETGYHRFAATVTVAENSYHRSVNTSIPAGVFAR